MHVPGKIIAAIEHLLEGTAGGGWRVPGDFSSWNLMRFLEARGDAEGERQSVCRSRI